MCTHIRVVVVRVVSVGICRRAAARELLDVLCGRKGDVRVSTRYAVRTPVIAYDGSRPITVFREPTEVTRLTKLHSPLTLASYALGSLSNNAAASPFKGSAAFGYRSNCGRNVSKMLTMSNMGDHVWLITSRQTEPDNSSMLAAERGSPLSVRARPSRTLGIDAAPERTATDHGVKEAKNAR